MVSLHRKYHGDDHGVSDVIPYSAALPAMSLILDTDLWRKPGQQTITGLSAGARSCAVAHVRFVIW